MKDMEAAVGFFKTFIEKESAKKLVLPPRKMNGIMNGKEGGPAILYGPDGRRWPVIIGKKDADWQFIEGWQAFVEGNSLEEKDLMTFKYIGDMQFDVELVGSVGVNKSTVRKRKYKDSAEGSHRTKDVKMFDEYGAPSSIQRSRGHPHVMTAKEQLVANSFSALSSGRPFLIRTLIWVPKKFPAMHIPSRFLRDHGLNLTPYQVIVLRNPMGERWKVKVSKMKGAFAMGMGFCNFLHKNHVKNGNVLVYEVIDPATMELKVHFYR